MLDERVADEDPAVLYSPLDEKPKRARDVRELARVRDIRARPRVTLLVDRWSEDWARLAWLRLRGDATIEEADDEPVIHRRMVDALRDKYPQYRDQRLERAPMIRIQVTDATAWGAL